MAHPSKAFAALQYRIPFALGVLMIVVSPICFWYVSRVEVKIASLIESRAASISDQLDGDVAAEFDRFSAATLRSHKSAMEILRSAIVFLLATGVSWIVAAWAIRKAASLEAAAGPRSIEV